jgi:hypothetical protein
MQGNKKGIFSFYPNKIFREGGTIMKGKKFLWSFLTVIMLLSMTVGAVLAEDGVLFRRNISKTPDNETEKAAIYMMDFYVPAQASTGELTVVDNYALTWVDENNDGVPDRDPDTGDLIPDVTAYDPRSYAKPLVSVYIDDLHPVDTKGGISFGHYDAFVGVSNDDGTTWKTTNLSHSSDLSSFTLTEGYNAGYDYPGDVHNVVHQVAKNNIFVAWVSKYCDGGTPLYTLDPEDEDKTDAAYLTALVELDLTPVYLEDLFGVAGSQGSVNYELQGFPEIGEIPYSCVWTARGKLVALDDPSTGDDPDTTDVENIVEATHVIWMKPERLTSGRRDANLPAVDCAADVGCMLTWQEDPQGLRPGQGLGPGEGWSGAIANQQTDIWYSYISWENFDKVLELNEENGFVSIQDFQYFLDNVYAAETSMPKVGVPMAMPVRLTDNNMCKALAKVDTNGDLLDKYCYYDFEAYELPAFTQGSILTNVGSNCDDYVEWTNPGGTELKICKTTDGRVLNGRVASTRVRLNLKPVDIDGDKINDKAFVVMAYEETKALGDTEVVCEEGDTSCVPTDPIDIGKDVWYHSFDMLNPDMVSQGGILNQPALEPLTDSFFEIEVDEFENEFYQTEIARRFALTTNAVSNLTKVDEVTGDPYMTSGLSAMLIYKQGIINQGGPADIMLRRVVVPDACDSNNPIEGCFDIEVDNPYDYKYMDCDTWDYKDGTNPNYLQGICLSPAINISGTTIVTCDDGTTTCATEFPYEGYEGELTGDFPKVTAWFQTPENLLDQPWTNPFDVSKGHRGFLDGDIVMMMYAWSPNWKANSVGNDHYNLYVRRSFDGGETWTTTPADLGGDGTTTCENIGLGNDVTEVCTTYGSGDFEQARNVSQLIGNKVTVLDPRYTPTGGMKLYPTISQWFIDLYNLNTFEGTLPYEDDETRDRSKFFIVYETGDNTTVAEGEATPLDLYYSRATNYGDDYEEVDYYTSKVDDNNVPIIVTGWDWLENKAEILSGEASIVANPGGTFMYSVWNQWQEEILEDGHELVFDSDIIFRRLMYLMDGDASLLNYSPIVSILASDQEVFGVEEDQVIYLYASARDLDVLNDEDLDPIQEYVWTINGQPFEYFDDGADCYQDKQCKAPARVIAGSWDGSQFREPGWAGDDGYNYGWYEFAVQVKDNDDPAKWSKIVKIKKYIGATQFDVPGFKIFLPLTTK